MRKLRRLPWRLPKQNPPPAQQEPAPLPPRSEVIERRVLTQPVAYIGGRYVYAPSSDEPSEARRTHVRHRSIRVAGNMR